MPVQQQPMSSFAKKLGGRVAAANEEHKDKPIDTGNRRLPAGIRDGVARLSTMYTKEYEDDKQGMKGQTFFRASAIVMSPEQHKGEKVAGMVTSIIISLCDVPEKGDRKAKPLSENWFEFQNVFKMLGIAPCPETAATDPTGARTEAYFFAAMKQLTDPVRMKTNPVYISFSTRGWTPPPNPRNPKPDEMVFETWHGLATWDGKVDPGVGMQDNLATQPPPAPPPQTQTATRQAAAPPPTNGQPPQYQPGGEPDPEDVVAALIEIAMNDQEGATEEGFAASQQLEQMAWAAGWTPEQTAKADDWAAVGNMALNPPTQAVTAPATTTPSTNGRPEVTVGSRWGFCKRDKAGAKLKNKDGVEFPAQDVEVVSVDSAAKTCVVKTTKDNKEVVDVRSKKPVQVSWAWLEDQPLPY